VAPRLSLGCGPAQAQEEQRVLATELRETKERWAYDKAQDEKIKAELKGMIQISQDREEKALEEASNMGDEMQRFFEQTKGQMEELKESEQRAQRESGELKTAMSRLDGKYKELTLSQGQSQDQNRRLEVDLAHSHTERLTNWAEREVALERTRVNVALYAPNAPVAYHTEIGGLRSTPYDHPPHLLPPPHPNVVPMSVSLPPPNRPLRESLIK